jgi:hypothetical protein
LERKKRKGKIEREGRENENKGKIGGGKRKVEEEIWTTDRVRDL